MSLDIDKEVAVMEQMSIGELREKYERVFGETTTSRHPSCLIRRIAWRMQANEQGGISCRARHVSPETIQADIDAGAPVNDDGTVNLIAYAAWLVQKMADGD